MMEQYYVDLILYGLLEITCIVYAWFGRPVMMPTVTPEDNLVILDTNIGFLYLSAKCLDHMVGVIYFGFLITFFILAYFHSSLEQKVSVLEQLVEQIATTGHEFHERICSDNNESYRSSSLQQFCCKRKCSRDEH